MLGYGPASRSANAVLREQVLEVAAPARPDMTFQERRRWNAQEDTEERDRC